MSNTVEIEDFSGGVTDYYLYAPPNKMRYCDNLLINQYPQMGKPFTRPGSDLYDEDYPQLPSGNQRISTALYYKDILYAQSAAKLYYYDATTGWNEIEGPTTNDAFIGAATTDYFNYANWNYHTLFTNTDLMYPKKVIKGNSGAPFLVEAGLPKFNKTGVVFTPTAGANTYLYKLVYRYDYLTEGAVTFSDVGAPSDTITVAAAAAPSPPSTNPIAITVIPVLSNGGTSNFDTTNIKVDIYRTTASGSIFYYVGTVNNGTTTYNDTTSDATLLVSTTLYTTGGVAANDRPMRCRCVHVMGDTAYYGHILDEGSELLDFRVQQSIPGDIDASPASFFVDVDDEIIAISSTKSNAVILCRNSAYRIDGAFDELGRGGMTVEKISDTAGCVSPQGAVQALDGVFWLGLDGAYFTDGFRVIKLNQDFDQTYKTYVTNSGLVDDTKTFKIQGKYDKKKNRIWWTIQQDGATDVNSCYVLDLNWGVREKATFTTVTGQSFAPSAIEFINGNMIRCDKRGYVLEHRDTLTSDPKIDTSIAATSWAKESIIYTLETISFNFGTSATRKYVTQVNVTCESSSNLSLQIVSNNDDNKVVGNLKPIRYRGNITWGDEDIYWGDASLTWNQQGLISEKRRMPAGGLRCNFKSIKLTNAFVAIINSDSIGTVTVDATAKTATLTLASTYDWPSNAIDYYLAFETDGYVNEYLITARTDNVLTYSDSSNTSTSGSAVQWVLRGYPKNEVLNLLNLSLVYVVSGPTLNTYKTADSGEVG